ncbi:MAG: hypothetical protein FWF43_09290 [Propionibacteriaceae bacterium]|nr:hypothetical protein [Propionibacteriaceae bacterium]
MTSQTELPPHLIDLVTWVARPLGPVWAKQAGDQARSARIIDLSTTRIHLEPDPGLPVVPIPNGPLPWWACVEKEDQPLSEVMLWFRDGRLTELEQPWYTDDLPSAWPLASQVIVKGPSQTISEENYPEVAQWFREHPAEGLPFWSDDDGSAPWGSRG